MPNQFIRIKCLLCDRTYESNKGGAPYLIYCKCGYCLIKFGMLQEKAKILKSKFKNFPISENDTFINNKILIKACPKKYP
jgi:hypothetical protein